MRGPSIGDFASSAKADPFPALRERRSVVAQRLLALIGVVMFFCALAAPVFVPLLIH
jgi:hypothetical protein